MKSFWRLFYNLIALPLIYLTLYFASFFNKKIRKGISGRRHLFENLIISFTGFDRSEKLIWFHSSSLGEFEQAKPIIQKLKSEMNLKIIVSFFSPSGYQNSVNYPFADVITYLPWDNMFHAKRFINIVRPDLSVIMRYDIWPNFIWKLHESGIPIMLVDATMRKNSKRALPLSISFHRTLFSSIDRILAISENDIENFKPFSVDPEKIKAVGDTRFDRVYQKSRDAHKKKLFQSGLFDDKMIFVAGSTWESDEEILLPVFEKLAKYEKNLILLLVPHEPTIPNLERLENILHGRTIRFSFLNDYKNERIIIVIQSEFL